MIKDCCYIKRFSPDQRKQLEKLQEETKIKTVIGLLFFALEKYFEHVADIARHKRIIEYKQKKIERLEAQLSCPQ